jgi:IclR family transcriptional regulator, KDG regulon repressor
MNQSVQKAFEILSFIAETPQKMSLNQMAVKIGMNKSTLFRFLSTLESLEIIAKKDDCYVPGIKLFQWGSQVPVNQLLVAKIHPLLQQLTLEVNETVNMGQFSNNKVLYLDKSESQRSLQIKTSVGSYTELHATALGKSILSILPLTLRNSIIDSLIFERKTSNTITSPAKLKKQVDTVAQEGYSKDCEELEEGLHCVAVPLFIESLNFYGGISCSGPINRFTPLRMTQLAQQLKAKSQEIKKVFT